MIQITQTTSHVFSNLRNFCNAHQTYSQELWLCPACFAPLKYNVLSQEWTRAILSMMVDDYVLTVVNYISFLARFLNKKQK